MWLIWHNFKMRLLAGFWAFKYTDKLTMLKHELIKGSNEKNSHGRYTLYSLKCEWFYNRYLSDLPIS